MLWSAAAALLGATTPGAIAALRTQIETITIRQDFAGLYCAGLCLDSELTVSSDGTVRSRMRSAFHSEWDVSYRYRIPARDFAAFREALAGIRPVGLRGPIGDCRGTDWRTDGTPDLTIQWRGSGRADQLTGCGLHQGAVPEAVGAAYRILRINPNSGARMSKAEAVALYRGDVE